MTDFWSFLLQTLTASGAAALLLAVKALLRDKLSPRWQFAVWGILAVILLLPAGLGGRYVLVNWPMWVEALKSTLTGDFGTLTRVAAPFPLPPAAPPGTVFDWLYLAYVLGAAVLLARYALSYIRLRLALRSGRPAQDGPVRAVAERYGLPLCPAVEVDGLPTAFICGALKPVLALPAGVETDDKVILHELLHLKYRDVVWGWVIAFFRCLHWCNPLLWYCADRACNDLESLCDQRALERLEGEERRDYGRILLSMADERYARTPGTSSAANGGKNIRRRIEAIARFKRYPAGMALASVCVALVLAVPLAVGARAEDINSAPGGSTQVRMAAARTTGCTTYAGAFDTYAKAVLTQRFDYRAMCAPLSEQNALAEQGWRLRPADWRWPEVSWKDKVNTQAGYQIYDLAPAGEDAYEGLLAFELYSPPNGEQWSGRTAERWLAVQWLRAEKEGDRWVIVPQEGIRAVPGDERVDGNLGLPCRVYEGQYGDWLIQARWQTTAAVNSQVQNSDGFWNMTSFDSTPKPHAQFDQGYYHYRFQAAYTGDPDKKSGYASISLAALPVYGENDREPEPIGPEYLDTDSSGTSNQGNSFTNRILEQGWEDTVYLSGGGGGLDWGTDGAYLAPSAYRVKLYLNGEEAGELTLLPVEGGEWIEP